MFAARRWRPRRSISTPRGSGEFDDDLPVLDFNGIGSNGLPGGRSDDVPGRHVEPRAVPWALDDGALQPALAQRATQVGARIVETVYPPGDLEQPVWPLVGRHALRTAFRYLALHPQDGAHGPSRGGTC